MIKPPEVSKKPAQPPRTGCGGHRPRAGRSVSDPARGATDSRLTMRCHSADASYLRLLGAGSISADLRTCIALAQQQQQAEQSLPAGARARPRGLCEPALACGFPLAPARLRRDASVGPRDRGTASWPALNAANMQRCGAL